MGENFEPCATQNVTNPMYEMIQHVCAQSSQTIELSLRSIVTTHMYVLRNNVTTVRDEARVSQRKTRLQEQLTLFLHEALIGGCLSFYVKLCEICVVSIHC